MKTMRDKLRQLSGESKGESALRQESSVAEFRLELERSFKAGRRESLLPLQSKAESIVLEDRVSGKWKLTPYGDIYVTERYYPLSELYGSSDLSLAKSIIPENLTNLLQLSEAAGDYRSWLFLDTETTGLGGSGVVPFLIGLGWYEKEHFIVTQLFLSELEREAGQLYLLTEILKNFQMIISFNGRAYDLPLIAARYALNRQAPPSESMAHLDLLQPVRSLWKYAMKNCRLQTVEKEQLGLYREADIPGELIPGVYFDYLRRRDARKLASIFLHNELDIVSMAAALIELYQQLAQSEPVKDPRTEFAKGRHFLKADDIARSRHHFQQVLASEISKDRRLKTLLALGRLHRAAGDWENALESWRQAADESLPFALEPYLCLAKYFEHQTGEFSLALSITKEAERRLPQHRDSDRAALAQRHQRLITKLNRLAEKEKT
ncbi:MAG TPA: hypothetical protein ENN84_09295 [Candidatus Marinimicrobia bacterium]|nr:hypothetical protein [Candidatus Neomarinimicrobiota bacterium]